jgi:hypothetical protein
MLTTTVTAARLRAISAYLASRSLPLDPWAVLDHFERAGVTEDPSAVEADFFALLDRVAAQVRHALLPTPTRHGQAACVIREGLATLVERIETGRIDGRAAYLDERGCGCVLISLAEAVHAPSWMALREADDIPRPIERFVWHVRPGETHRNCPSLALVRAWVLRALG